MGRRYVRVQLKCKEQRPFIEVPLNAILNNPATNVRAPVFKKAVQFVSNKRDQTILMVRFAYLRELGYVQADQLQLVLQLAVKQHI